MLHAFEALELSDGANKVILQVKFVEGFELVDIL